MCYHYFTGTFYFASDIDIERSILQYGHDPLQKYFKCAATKEVLQIYYQYFNWDFLFCLGHWYWTLNTPVRTWPSTFTRCRFFNKGDSNTQASAHQCMQRFKKNRKRICYYETSSLGHRHYRREDMLQVNYSERCHENPMEHWNCEVWPQTKISKMLGATSFR